MNWYCARLCWNDYGWRRPSGPKSAEKKTFASKYGFGYEEWLFDFSRMLPINGDDYHYGFLQPVHRSLRNFAGKTIDVLLYSLDSSRRRVYVGKIHLCKVLTDEERKTAYAQYKKRGWISDMKAQIESAGGDSSQLEDNQSDPFNVRFSRKEADIFDPYLIASPDDYIMRLRRYTLTQVKPSIEKEWSHKGQQYPFNTDKYSRYGTQESIVDPTHKKLQNELFALLTKHYETEAVSMEENYIDIKVDAGGRLLLIELKTYSTARAAIRDALGQILEYAFHKTGISKDEVSLVIAAPGILRADDSAYIELLRKEFGLPVEYCTVSLGMNALPKALI